MKSSYPLRLHEALQSLAQPERADGAAAYMKNNFEFYGVATPDRRLLIKELVKEIGLPDNKQLHSLVRELWKAPMREMQYSAIDLMERCSKKAELHDIKLYEHCITHKSWWDSVDAIASHLVGNYFKLYPDEVDVHIPGWIVHEDMWLNRSAIIFQIGYKKNTNTVLLEKAILRHRESKQFFLQKAIGWALRSYSYTNPDYVRDFIERHELKALSVREALKAINRDGL